MRIIVASLTVMGIVQGALAQGTWAQNDKSKANTAQSTKTQNNQTQASNSTPIKLKDVETMMDNPMQYSGKRVTVIGKIDKHRGSRTFVSESGGIINDQVV